MSSIGVRGLQPSFVTKATDRVFKDSLIAPSVAPRLRARGVLSISQLPDRATKNNWFSRCFCILCCYSNSRAHSMRRTSTRDATNARETDTVQSQLLLGPNAQRDEGVNCELAVKAFAKRSLGT